MEVKEILPAVMLFVLVGMIIGVGVLALDKFGNAAKDSSTVTNESVTLSSGTGSLANDDVTALSDLIDNNGSILAGEYLKDITVNWTTGGTITVSSDNVSDGTVNITYVYDADSAATTAIASGRDEVSNVGTVWLGLIITILVLAIIITLVVRSFGGGRQ